jgi:hypothetical protein
MEELAIGMSLEWGGGKKAEMTLICFLGNLGYKGGMTAVKEKVSLRGFLRISFLHVS